MASDSRQIPLMPAAFDTIAAVRRLEDTGLSREAAAMDRLASFLRRAIVG